MIDTICQYANKIMSAATPWLVGTAAGFFLLWLAILIREKKPFEEALKRFAGLTPFRKFALILMLGFFTWWGGAKERGASSSVASDDVSPTQPRVVETVQPRSLPEEIPTNALAITWFEIDQANRTAYFETRWATNLFDYADSRNLYLFSSTNLQQRQWMLLGPFLMPPGTNSCVFAVTSNNVDVVMRPWFLDTFNGIGFYRFGIDIDTDGDGLTDSYENLVSLTNPFSSDTDGDGIPDGDEVEFGANPNSADTDGDGLPDAAELGAVEVLPASETRWTGMTSVGGNIWSSTTSANDGGFLVDLPRPYAVNGVTYSQIRICTD